jgi:phosphate/sulfate permease
MQVLIGGVVAAVLGLVGLIAWWKQFLLILMGGIPVALLLGGALAIYVGYDELKDQMREKKDKAKEAKEKGDELAQAKEELEKAKAEAEKYKAEAKQATKAKKKEDK